MNRIVLLLSQEFNYDKIIVPDCGPFYSRSLGISSTKIETADWDPSVTWIVDNRMTEKELQIILHVISKKKQTKFLIRIVDPYWETAISTPQLRFAFKISSLHNVGFLSPYQPEEAVSFLFETSLISKKFFVSPYPYNKDDELEFESSWKRRKRGCALAGRPDKSIYPYRSFLRRKKWTDLRIWGKVGMLCHPGYPDLGVGLTHNKVGGSFISWLASYESAYLCPSRCHLEFLKYRECAYAGCCPIGAMPRTMSGELSSLILPLDWQGYQAKRDFWLGMSRAEIKKKAWAYREAMRKERDPQVLRTQLLERLAGWRI